MALLLVFNEDKVESDPVSFGRPLSASFQNLRGDEHENQTGNMAWTPQKGQQNSERCFGLPVAPAEN